MKIPPRPILAKAILEYTLRKPLPTHLTPIARQLTQPPPPDELVEELLVLLDIPTTHASKWSGQRILKMINDLGPFQLKEPRQITLKRAELEDLLVKNHSHLATPERLLRSWARTGKIDRTVSHMRRDEIRAYKFAKESEKLNYLEGLRHPSSSAAGDDG